MSRLPIDSRNGPPDVAYKPRGPGMPGQTFRCGACGQFRGLLGRRMQKVKSGLRDWVCKECVR